MFLARLLDADTARFALFIGLSGATYKTVLALLRRWSKRKVSQLGCYIQACTNNCLLPQRDWHAVVAGLAAGLVSSLDEATRRRTLSHFVTARALGALAMTLHSRGYIPSIPYFTVLIFGLCESFIVVAITKHPELLPHSYYRSVLKWSMCYTNDILEVSTSCYPHKTIDI